MKLNYTSQLPALTSRTTLSEIESTLAKLKLLHTPLIPSSIEISVQEFEYLKLRAAEFSKKNATGLPNSLAGIKLVVVK